MDPGQGIKNPGSCEGTGATCRSVIPLPVLLQVKAENRGGDWRQGLREPEATTGFVHVQPSFPVLETAYLHVSSQYLLKR